MKKKFLSLLLAICMILPCVFMLGACDEECNSHNLTVQYEPTLNEKGELFCGNCMKKVELPTLNGSNYQLNDTNPDYKIYAYNVDNQTFEFTVSNFVFQPTEKGYVILDYTGNSANVVIPDIHRSKNQYYEEIPVIGIDTNMSNDGAFENNITITSIILPPTLKNINTFSFKGCVNLTEIVLGSANVEPNTIDLTVSFDAFDGCTSLESVYYRGTKSQWETVSIHDQGNTTLKNANIYCYSKTKPTGLDYLNDNQTWHYDENNNKVLWELNFTNNVDNKSFTYSHSEVAFSDAYWAMLKEAQAQNRLGDLFNDQEQIEMVTSSATKAEYETKFAAWYGTTMGTQAVVSFADDKITITLLGNSGQADYIEVDGEIYDVAKKEKVFAFDTTNNSIYEERADEHSTIRHIYSIVE
ncbi:MAG: leucine-rich repeat protein [Clostridia bacterium]|nr:leucine-rich repeat protein [Clostridia bacterium]